MVHEEFYSKHASCKQLKHNLNVLFHLEFSEMPLKEATLTSSGKDVKLLYV